MTALSDAQITENVGRWLSAALDDPQVCDEMKNDIRAWMEAGTPNVQPSAVNDETGREREALIALVREFICEFWIDKPTMKWRRTLCDDGVEMVHHEGDTIFFGDPNHREPPDTKRFDLIVQLANSAPALLHALSAAPVVDAVATVTYTNWRGETSVRRIIPKSVRYGSTEWHPEPQWLLLAWDDDKKADREFALKDFGAAPVGEPARKRISDIAIEVWLGTSLNVPDEWRETGNKFADQFLALFGAQVGESKRLHDDDTGHVREAMVSETIELKWRYRSTRDSEFAEARYKCFDILVQDCDGDLTRWHIKRGDQYVAVGETFGIKGVYHMDHATEQAVTTLGFLVKAVNLNDFVHREMPRLVKEGVISP